MALEDARRRFPEGLRHRVLTVAGVIVRRQEPARRAPRLVAGAVNLVVQLPGDACYRAKVLIAIVSAETDGTRFVDGDTRLVELRRAGLLFAYFARDLVDVVGELARCARLVALEHAAQGLA